MSLKVRAASEGRQHLGPAAPPHARVLGGVGDEDVLVLQLASTDRCGPLLRVPVHPLGLARA
eukprot:8476322-Lingulodinium_polyedra.AAC.1